MERVLLCCRACFCQSCSVYLESSGNIKLSPNQTLHKSATAASRFHLPSPATSLPALALASDSAAPPSDSKPVVKHRKEKRNAEIKSNKPSPSNKNDSAKSKTNPPSKAPSRFVIVIVL
ncbi:hypothetical protein LSTR_LSTR017487 [Laodelphax striatellus]|uniref:Uncharacterized protein n=1 Tax=Laodelphax striatellus TaxID=195883 RepID=A0A482XJ97_LAOST|nr:hypothetical protein LSTR_LSTR017487 [Laodelphax striatellus]